MVSKLALLSLVLAACTSDGKTAVDAATVHDAPAMVADSHSVDSPGGTVCTGALYDPCTGATGNCMSGMCRAFNSGAFSACTQACSTSNPCPAQNGNPISCNMMGQCRVTTPNACTPP